MSPSSCFRLVCEIRHQFPLLSPHLLTKHYTGSKSARVHSSHSLNVFLTLVNFIIWGITAEMFHLWGPLGLWDTTESEYNSHGLLRRVSWRWTCSICIDWLDTYIFGHWGYYQKRTAYPGSMHGRVYNRTLENVVSLYLQNIMAGKWWNQY